jgi:hypothetical protein
VASGKTSAIGKRTINTDKKYTDKKLLKSMFNSVAINAININPITFSSR